METLEVLIRLILLGLDIDDAEWRVEAVIAQELMEICTNNIVGNDKDASVFLRHTNNISVGIAGLREEGITETLTDEVLKQKPALFEIGVEV